MQRRQVGLRPIDRNAIRNRGTNGESLQHDRTRCGVPDPAAKESGIGAGRGGRGADVGTACSSSSDSGGSPSDTGSTESANAEFVSLGGWNDGACSDAKPKVEVALIAPIEAPGTSLGDYADGANAGVEAFNQRGGISGGCLALTVCDSKGDGPTELACARNAADDAAVVAGLASTFTSVESDAYQLFEASGLSQVGAQVTLPSAWNSPVSFEFTMGGSGTLLADIPALDKVGVKKFDVFVPQSGHRARSSPSPSR